MNFMPLVKGLANAYREFENHSARHFKTMGLTVSTTFSFYNLYFIKTKCQLVLFQKSYRSMNHIYFTIYFDSY